ncbi:MAG: YqaJ viral recombinase family protein [Bacillota bacterium]
MMTHDEWLAARKKGLGGSDAAAILGLNPYETPYSVWADKLDLLPEKEDNESMRQGRDLEDYVAKRFCEETGKKVRRNNKIIHSKDYPWALANVDRMIVGENAGLECKTTATLNLKQFAKGEYPATYYCQCVHYMAVTGADKWYLAVLVLGKQFHVFEIERDEKEIESLMSEEGSFWKDYVETETPPGVDGLDPTGEALEFIYRESDEEGAIDLFGRGELLSDYFDLAAEIKDKKQQQELIKQTLQQELGALEVGITDGYKVTWKPQTRNSLDKGLLLEKYPDLDISDCLKTSTSRVMRIREVK